MFEPSKTEDLLFETMLNIGLKPERQYPISKMHVDFAFPKEKLVIEVDGHYKRNAEGMRTLFNRRRICEREGWKVENFTAEEVHNNPVSIVWRIMRIINNENNKKETEKQVKLKPIEKNETPTGWERLKKIPSWVIRKAKTGRAKKVWKFGKEVKGENYFYRIIKGRDRLLRGYRKRKSERKK